VNTAMTDTIEIPVTPARPAMQLKPATPQTIELQFAPVVYGRDGQDGETPDANDLDGFTIDPLAYYILSRD
jgi:hypothetical protein